MKMEIRSSASEDVSEMVKLIHAAFEKYRGKLNPPTGAHNETVQSIQSELTKGGAFIAESNRKLVGCVLWANQGKNLYFGRLAVLPEYRNHGIGSKLIHAIEQKASGIGCSGLLIKVRTSLPELVVYYSGKGFVELLGQDSESSKYE